MARGGQTEKREENVVVAIDKDKGSQHALKWTVDYLLSRGQSLTLLHVKQKPVSGQSQVNLDGEDGTRNLGKELFLPFRCFCTRKDIKCNEIIVEDQDITKTLINYIASNAIDILVLGAPTKSGFVRKFKTLDITSSVLKGAPDFCTVYIIGKGKVQSVRSASSGPPKLPSRNTLQTQPSQISDSNSSIAMRNQMNQMTIRETERYASRSPRYPQEDMEIKSPFQRGKPSINKSYELSPDTDISFVSNRRQRINKSYELSPDTDISFVSNGRQSIDCLFPTYYDAMNTGATFRLSTGFDYDLRNYGSSLLGNKSPDMSNPQIEITSNSYESGRSWPSQNLDDVEAEMRRLKQELKQTMAMYSSACKEAHTAKQKTIELQRWKLAEQQRLEEARMAEEAALALAEKEKAKCRAAMDAAEAAQRLVELEAQKRMLAELRAKRESEENNMSIGALNEGNLKYRRYTIEEIEAATNDFADNRKIGEGGYGPVYKGELDHTQVAIKILRPDAAQGRSQFQREVEVLSCIRHPNMVLLVGACPEFGCLVYEYMANGSLEDCLIQQGNTRVLPWQLRFRIAAEIATGLLFLHQTKPEPLVHRDLKPGNILLDRNYVSKISDVGLARLVPPSIADTVTQYRMTSTAGTFCYIDPEYQQTGMLGIKSDVYSLGIILLQILTSKPPMGLTHHVERAIEEGTFAEMLDPTISDWPVEEALEIAKIGLQCAELRRKDRPDLGKVVLPMLNRMRELAEDNMTNMMMTPAPRRGSNFSSQDVMSDSSLPRSGYDSSRSPSSTSSSIGRP